eukprot:COSAG02_NODE_24550_length_684_cov_1.658120_1_plen_182_part_01
MQFKADWFAGVIFKRYIVRRLLLDAAEASAVGSLIDAAVQSSVGEDRQRPRSKQALAKWLLARRDVVPPENACEHAGIMLEEELGGWVTVPAGQKIVVGKRRRKRLSAASLPVPATGAAEAAKDYVTWSTKVHDTGKVIDSTRRAEWNEQQLAYVAEFMFTEDFAFVFVLSFAVNGKPWQVL